MSTKSPSWLDLLIVALWLEVMNLFYIVLCCGAGAGPAAGCR